MIDALVLIPTHETDQYGMELFDVLVADETARDQFTIKGFAVGEIGINRDSPLCPIRWEPEH